MCRNKNNDLFLLFRKQIGFSGAQIKIFHDVFNLENRVHNIMYNFYFYFLRLSFYSILQSPPNNSVRQNLSFFKKEKV